MSSFSFSFFIVWDEGFTLGRESRVRAWFRAVRDPGKFAIEWRPSDAKEELVIEYGSAPPPRQQLDTRSKLIFERRVVEWFWPFAREEPHGHPPFDASVGPSGDLLTPSWEQLPQALLATHVHGHEPVVARTYRRHANPGHAERLLLVFFV